MLPTDSKDRKTYPMARGLVDYFPDALAAVANVSFVGNQQHNPGQEMHWARDKSSDHADCIMRHMTERGQRDTDGLRHSAKLAWRALALLQLELEAAESKPEVDESRSAEYTSRADPATAGADKSYSWALSTLTPRKRGYISGPMTGRADLNWPAFDSAECFLLALGLGPLFNPAQMDRAAGWLAGKALTSPTDKRAVVDRDLRALIQLKAEHGDTLYLLPEWEKSQGAVAEFLVASWLGLQIRNADGSRVCTVNGKDLLATCLRVLNEQATKAIMILKK